MGFRETELMGLRRGSKEAILRHNDCTVPGVQAATEHSAM
jgi:hypothetical protein